jgi:hypothetical protein
MTENLDDGRSVEAAEAEQALALSERGRLAGEAAARQYVRRYLIGFGGLLSGWLCVIAATATWLDSAGELWRALATGVSAGLVAGAVLLPARAAPVRVQLRTRIPMVAGGVLLFALPAGYGAEQPLIALAAAPVVFGYWTACAWWLSRAR